MDDYGRIICTHYNLRMRQVVLSKDKERDRTSHYKFKTYELSPVRLERTTSGSGGQRSIQLSYGDENYITQYIISACPHILQAAFTTIFTKFSSGRQSDISLLEQLVYHRHCFCPLVCINLAIILHSRCKVYTPNQYPHVFRITYSVRPPC